MTEATLRFSPHQAQWSVMQSEARFRVLVAGRRFGKSYLACMLAIMEGLKTENERGVQLSTLSEVALFSPTLEQARRNVWNLLKELAKPVTDKVHENSCVLTLVNGVRIRLLGADNPDAARGMSLRFAVLDEYASMPADMWREIVRPALADMRGGAMFIGTPKGRNHFWEAYLGALSDASGYEDWEAFTFEQADNPYIHPDEAKALAAEYTNGSESLYEQEILGKFITSGGDLFHEDQFKEDPKEPNGGEYFIAVDLAGFSKESGKRSAEVKRLDDTAIAIVKVLSTGHWWVKEIQYGRWDVRETAFRIVKAARDNQALGVGIEKGALMNAVDPYLTEYQRQLGFFIDVKPLTHGNTRKFDRIQWALQGRFQKGQISFNPGKYLDDLKDQAISFPSKLVHDDLIDALAYIDQIALPLDMGSFITGPDEYVPLDEIAGY